MKMEIYWLQKFLGDNENKHRKVPIEVKCEKWKLEQLLRYVRYWFKERRREFNPISKKFQLARRSFHFKNFITFSTENLST